MKILHNFVVLVVTSILLTGCGTFAKVADSGVTKKVQIGLDVVLLDREFESVLDALLDNDWSESERIRLEVHVAELQLIRNQINEVIDGNTEAGAKLVIEASDAVEYLNRVASEYNAIRGLYITYITRNGLPVDSEINSYNDSAVRIHGLLFQVASSGQDTSAEAILDMLSYVARGYLQYRLLGNVNSI